MHIHDLFTSIQPWDSPELSGSAHFYLPADGYEWILDLDEHMGIFSDFTREAIKPDRIHLDLVIDTATFAYAEFEQITPHVGDSFSHHFYGKQPVVMNVSGHLVDTRQSIGKAAFMELYRWVFRASRVARTNVVPCLYINGCLFQGAMLGVNTRETGGIQDIVQVQFPFFIFALYYEKLEGVNLASAHGGLL